MSPYAARIRAARAYADLRQDQLARALGVTTETIKRRERGTQAPKRGELLAIAQITGVPASFMEHGFGEVEPSEVLERLDRIEAALSGGDLESRLEDVREAIRELAADADDDGSSEPTSQRDPDPRQAEQSPPRARSRRRS